MRREPTSPRSDVHSSRQRKAPCCDTLFSTGCGTCSAERSRLERLLLKWLGPFSKPLKPASAKEEYDMRECAVVDEIGGPGWCWPEPDRTCFWADRADARLLVPLKHVEDHLLVLAFADHQRRSPNGRIGVFANGLYVTEIDLSEKSLGYRVLPHDHTSHVVRSLGRAVVQAQTVYGRRGEARSWSERGAA